MLSCGNLTFSYGPGFLFMRYENHAKKKKKESQSQDLGNFRSSQSVGHGNGHSRFPGGI